MSDDDPHWPLRIAFRIAWFVALIPAALLWLSTRLDLPRLIDWTLTTSVIGAMVGSAKVVFRRGKLR